MSSADYVTVIGSCNCGCDCQVVTIQSDTDEIITISSIGPPGAPAGNSPSIVVFSDYTVIDTDSFVVANSSSDINVTIPDPASFSNRELNFINIGTGAMILIGTISGETNFSINRIYNSVSIKSIGGQWLVW